MDDKTAQLAKILQESDNIVFFGGAGVSTASGIPDFRSSDGLYSQKLGRNFTPEQLVSHSFFMRYPDDFFDFYKKNLVYPDPEPNDCHIALAKLEEMGRLKAVITQNIDGLHQAAGSKTVYELHGSDPGGTGAGHLWRHPPQSPAVPGPGGRGKGEGDERRFHSGGEGNPSLPEMSRCDQAGCCPL